MKFLYSKTTNGFYPIELKSDYEKAGTWPDDAIELTPEEVEAYQGKQPPEGKQLGSVNGRPAWVDIPPLSQEELNKQQIQEAKQYLASTDWYYARKMETGEEVPADVVTKRLEARTLINELEEVL